MGNGANQCSLANVSIKITTLKSLPLHHCLSTTGTSCINKPEPPANSGILFDNYQGNITVNENSTYEFNTFVTYKCQNGMRWRGEFERSELNVACSEGNIWNLTTGDPAWGECVAGNLLHIPQPVHSRRSTQFEPPMQLRYVLPTCHPYQKMEQLNWFMEDQSLDLTVKTRVPTWYLNVPGLLSFWRLAVMPIVLHLTSKSPTQSLPLWKKYLATSHFQPLQPPLMH